MIAYTIAFVTPVMEKIAQSPWGIDPKTYRTINGRSTTDLYLTPIISSITV